MRSWSATPPPCHPPARDQQRQNVQLPDRNPKQRHLTTSSKLRNPSRCVQLVELLLVLMVSMSLFADEHHCYGRCNSNDHTCCGSSPFQAWGTNKLYLDVHKHHAKRNYKTPLPLPLQPSLSIPKWLPLTQWDCLEIVKRRQEHPLSRKGWPKTTQSQPYWPVVADSLTPF
jgi:hypothetical protein